MLCNTERLTNLHGVLEQISSLFANVDFLQIDFIKSNLVKSLMETGLLAFVTTCRTQLGYEQSVEGHG